MAELERVWLGDRYDLLTRNCNHFSEKLCDGLGVGAEWYFVQNKFDIETVFSSLDVRAPLDNPLFVVSFF